MGARRHCLTPSLVALAWLSLIPTGLEADERPSALFERAADLSDIYSISTPFRLHAGVDITDAKGRRVSGSYLLVWVSEARWREEITFPGYARLRIGDAGKYWQTRTTSVEMDRVFQLSQALDFVFRMREEAQNGSGKVKGRKRNGERVNCVAVRPAGYAEQEVCFSAENGALFREDLPRGEADGQSEISAREYSDFVNFEGKMFPHSVRVLEGTNPVITVSIDGLAKQTGLDPNLFKVASGDEGWQSCFGAKAPVYKSRVPPHYPEHAKARRITGLVRMYAVVGAGGQVDRLSLLHSPDAELSTAAMDAVRHWVYDPATCGGTPVPSETLIDVTFLVRE